MKTKWLVMSSLFILGFSAASFADTEVTYTGVSPGYNNGGGSYTTTVTPPAPQSFERRDRDRDRDHSHFSFGFGIDDSHVAYSADSAYTTVEVVNTGHRHHHHRTPLQWIDMMRGEPLPPGAVIGGNQPTPPYNLFICRGEYQGGVHPGKIVAGYCNISWEGDEISLPSYQVLISRVPLGWVPASYGQIPMNAVAGGYEMDDTLYICKARYHGGYHPGKVVGQNCNISWNDREIALPHYQVLTM